MADLGKFLAENMGVPRQAGLWDCAAFPAAWVVRCGFPDPMAGHRGAYSTETEARDYIERAGGLRALCEKSMRRAGVPKVSAPWHAGDVAIVSVYGHEAGGVYTGRRWAFVASRGLVFSTLPPENISEAWGPTRG